MITGVFTITVVALVAGVVVEPIADVVIASDAVRALGWRQDAIDIRSTVLRWSMLLGIVFFVVWAAMWAIRRSRTTEVRRR